MKTLKLISFAFFILLAVELSAQDKHFSQLSETPVMLNPANTGFFDGYLRTSTNYRNQWAAMGNPYRTMGLSIDGGILKSRKRPAYLGIGLTMFSDKAGAANISNTQIMLNASGVVKVSKKSKLSAGINGGSVMNNADFGALTYASQFNGAEIDPTLPSQEAVSFRKFTYTDIGAGTAFEYYSVKSNDDRDDIISFRLGLAAHHLNRARQEWGVGSSYRLPIKTVLHASARIDVPKRSLAVYPMVVYMYQKPGREITAGALVKYRFRNGTKTTGKKIEKGIAFGAYYRVKDAIIPQVLMDLGHYAIGISYDANISGYKQVTRTIGGFELTLRYNWLSDAMFKKQNEYAY